MTVLATSCLRSPDKEKYLLMVPRYTFSLPEEIVPYTPGITKAEPGTLYSVATSVPGDVVYLAGNLPIIITVPHGGSAAPADIPDRSEDCDEYIATANDVQTIALACDIVEGLMNLTHGKYPHLVINNLCRTRIDQNRDWGEDCNPVDGRGGDAWIDFHEVMTGAVAIGAVLGRFGAGLLVDLHGKPNSGEPDYSLYWESVMIGYNLTSTVLSYSDEVINDQGNEYAERSSLRFLSAREAHTIDLAGLLRGGVRGHESYGALLQDGLDQINRNYGKDYTIVPSDLVPAPAYLYLSGEYNIKAFCGVKDGSIDNLYAFTPSRFISGFQLEVCREIRDTDPALRKDFAREVAKALRLYIARHYHLLL